MVGRKRVMNPYKGIGQLGQSTVVRGLWDFGRNTNKLAYLEQNCVQIVTGSEGIHQLCPWYEEVEKYPGTEILNFSDHNLCKVFLGDQMLRERHLGVLAYKEQLILYCNVELEEFPLNELFKKKHSFEEHKNSRTRLKEFESQSATCLLLGQLM